MTMIPQRYRQTDGQTTCHCNTALCVASRGKNCCIIGHKRLVLSINMNYLDIHGNNLKLYRGKSMKISKISWIFRTLVVPHLVSVVLIGATVYQVVNGVRRSDSWRMWRVQTNLPRSALLSTAVVTAWVVAKKLTTEINELSAPRKPAHDLWTWTLAFV